ncbi:hypothetical protein B7486_17525 [cyanobacterium TDX16]|nr:hypothetical protein B7486_17525 [cyanobacterium TDX16]
MLPTFLAQLAAGSALAVGVSEMRKVDWRYLRLMSIVSLAIVFISLLLVVRESWVDGSARQRPAIAALIAACVIGVIWLFVNAAQGETVRAMQRLWTFLFGAAAMTGAILLATGPDVVLAEGESIGGIHRALGATTIVLGAGLLGTATAAMLLGHRYLTDTGMSISPLKRLTQLYLGILAVRGVWIIAASYPLWAGAFVPRGGYTWFWLMISVRFGIGLVVTGVFAWMIRDCVNRRATQSATAIFYLSMIFIFLGELSGQYLLRTESLAM